MCLSVRHPSSRASSAAGWKRSFPLTVVLVLVAAAATGATHLLRDLDLAPGLVAEITDDASLVLRVEDTGRPLITARPEVTGARRGGRTSTAPFVAKAADGDPGGQRGFAARADDDGDGRVDEDRLDGRDNDGDGQVDEDHAAIGDAMTVVSRSDGVHAEFYHFTPRQLRPTVFVTLAADGPGRTAWQLEAEGDAWVEMEIGDRRHRPSGRPAELTVHTYVTRTSGNSTNREHWVGVSILDDPAGDGVGRAVLDGVVLRVHLGRRPLAVAVSAAPSWSGLVRRLAEARLVRDGVSDPVDGRRAPWIVVPGCAACRREQPPDFRWRFDDKGHLVLLAKIEPGRSGRLDPDLFRLLDHDLGAPDQVVWTPREGATVGVAWSRVTPEAIARRGAAPRSPCLSLEGLSSHDAEGVLSFRFRSPHPALVRRLVDDEPPSELTLALLDGRVAQVKLEFDVSSTDPVRSAFALARNRSGQELLPADQQRLLQAERSRPSLAPALLEGWPNPFRDRISLRFRIPATVGEAFVWEDPDDRPARLDPQAPVPWTRSEPMATVKIYGIDGQELATLHAETVPSGEVTVHWNGTDSFGRKVASGTYFCKLQLDDWTITRRIVFVR